MKETALNIAKIYLEKNPRKELYPISFESTDIPNEGTLYFELTEHEKEVLSTWELLPNEKKSDYSFLHEYLEANNHWEILDKFMDASCPNGLDLVIDCNLNGLEKFTTLSVKSINTQNQIISKKINIFLTDEDYVDILSDFLMNQYFSFNYLLIKKPYLAGKITEDVFNRMNFPCLPLDPFVIYFDEISAVANKIMNPQIDVINLFDSEEQILKDFATMNSYAPVYISSTTEE